MMKPDLEVRRYKNHWALLATVEGRTQIRPFHYKADAQKALEEFSFYTPFQLEAEFNHYFQPLS